MLKALLNLPNFALRRFHAWKQARRMASVERAMRAAWGESKSRCERDFLPYLAPERAAYIRARLELDCWAWAHGVAFDPFLRDRDDERGEMEACA